MIAQIEQRRAELEALCRRFHVRRLEVFGSYFRESVERTKAVVYAA
jgi:predicted nucleotidyltransferase